MRSLKLYLVTALFVALPTNLFAAISVNLSSPDDLTMLTPGQVITIDVDISGLVFGDQISVLSADILLPGNFSAPTGLNAGNLVVSDPAFTFDPYTIIIPNSPSVVSALFDDNFFTYAPIVDNGVFFTFQTTVAGVGAGVIQFDPGAPPQVFGFDNNFDIIDTVAAGSALSFNINAVVVPEPGGLLVWSLLSSVGLVGWRCRRFRS